MVSARTGGIALLLVFLQQILDGFLQQVILSFFQLGRQNFNLSDQLSIDSGIVHSAIVHKYIIPCPLNFCKKLISWKNQPEPS